MAQNGNLVAMLFDHASLEVLLTDFTAVIWMEDHSTVWYQLQKKLLSLNLLCVRGTSKVTRRPTLVIQPYLIICIDVTSR